MRRIRNSILVIFLCVSYILPLGNTFAEDRRMPGHSVYFRSDTLYLIKQRDKQRAYLNDMINTVADWDHAKSMALRAYLYQYCGQKAKEYLISQGTDPKKLTDYNKYIYFQSQIYQSLQPTVTKIRIVLDDKLISFPIVLAHLQSKDPYLHYFYSTLPQRYNDKIIQDTVDAIQVALRRYYVANDQYPVSLTDLITYKFLPKDTVFPKNTILYRAYNVPKLVPITVYPPRQVKPQKSTYVLVFHVEHSPNIMFTTRDITSLRLRINTFALSSWENLLEKKVPQGVGDTLGWRIATP